MATIDVAKLVKDMLAAAQGVLKKKWPNVRDYAESEFNKIAESILFIEKQRTLGLMSEERAKSHLRIQRNATEIVLMSIEGFGILAVEAALNAALAIIKDTVNKALGFALL